MIIFILFYSGCKNPFSPAFDDSPGGSSSTISDLSTVEGVFQNFQYAYTFKDTMIYGEFISPDFIFSFINFNNEIAFNDSWGRDREMRSTYGLLQTAQRVDIIWNNIILSNQDSLVANIIRGFNLTVTWNSTDIERIDGRANMSLRKNLSNNKWQITRWVDESDL